MTTTQAPAISPDETRFCRNCGKPFSEGDHFCAACGSPRATTAALEGAAESIPREGRKLAGRWRPYPQTGIGWIGFVIAALIGFVLALLLLAPGGPEVALAAGGCGFIGGAIGDGVRGRPARGWTYANAGAWLAVAVVLAAFGVGFPARTAAPSSVAAVTPNAVNSNCETNVCQSNAFYGISNVDERVTDVTQTTVEFDYSPSKLNLASSSTQVLVDPPCAARFEVLAIDSNSAVVDKYVPPPPAAGQTYGSYLVGATYVEPGHKYHIRVVIDRLFNLTGAVFPVGFAVVPLCLAK